MMDFNTTNQKSNRATWEFCYRAEQLVEAASAKIIHHQQRLQWWQQQHAETMAEVRESGLEVNESVGSLYATSVSHGPQLSVRPDLQKKLSEIHGKLKSHTDAAREYEGWVQVLNASPRTSLKLTHFDWLFFFGE